MFIINSLEILFKEGGATAYFIVGSGIALVILAIAKINYLYVQLRPAGDSNLKEVSRLVLKKEYTAAIQVCNTVKNVPEFEVIKSGLMAVDGGREAMKSSLGSAVVDIMKNCEKGIQFLALIASVATLLGLLGTISGLMKTFAALKDIDPAKKAELLGTGISEAMTATAAGLVVGISAMVIHTLCTQKIDQIIGQAKKTGFDIITLVEQSERA
ncbi:MAG: MotA/TolQ/ExbB proton channel family protein [Deltaproteobacteria bacterium]|jgi:biopolymer transport protein ExbB|nr:MotA/TolQ/ExbB proton channel family protein [Deltaproteobacteria bacterium]